VLAASSEPEARTSAPARPLLRSLLFVPATKPSWVESAIEAGADAIILDLEDAVPADSKADARQAAAEIVSGWQSEARLFVRVNPLTGIGSIDELRSVVGPRLSGVMLPKVSCRADVVLADRLLGWCEAELGLAAGTVALVPLLETPAALWDAHGIARTAGRVAYLGAVTSRGGDIERSVGFRWTPEGTETLVFRSSVLLAARAAGVHNPVSGLWTDLRDSAGLQRFAELTRQIGYAGMLAIHPSQVAIINRAFTLSDQDIERYQRIIAAVENGSANGSGAVLVDGVMVDEAMAITARAELWRAAGAAEQGNLTPPSGPLRHPEEP